MKTSVRPSPIQSANVLGLPFGVPVQQKIFSRHHKSITNTSMTIHIHLSNG